MRLFILLFSVLALVARAESGTVSPGYRMELDAVEIKGETYYIATIYGDITPAHPDPTAASSGADEDLYQAGKQVTVDASNFVLHRELEAWHPAAARFLTALKASSPFGLQGTVLMAAFKKGNEREILATTKFAYPTEQNKYLPYENTFNLRNESSPPPQEQDYEFGDTVENQRGERRDLLNGSLELGNASGSDAGRLHSRVTAGGAIEFGAWVKNEKSPVDLLPVMWYLAERKGLDTLAMPLKVGNRMVNVYPAEIRAWCPDELVSYYGQFGFRLARELAPGIALITASRQDLRNGVRQWIRQRIARSPELQNVNFRFGVHHLLEETDPAHRREMLTALFGKHCFGLYRSFANGDAPGGRQN